MADENPEDNYSRLLPERPTRYPQADRPDTWLDPMGMVLGIVGLAGVYASFAGFATGVLWLAPALIVPLCIVLAVATRGAVSLGAPPKVRRRPSLAGAMFGSMLWLGIGSWRDFDTLIWDLPVAWNLAAAALGGLLIAALVARADPAEMSDRLMLVLSAIGGAVWTAGLLLELNAALPPRAIAEKPSVLVDQATYSHRRGPDSYVLWLAPIAGGDAVRIEVNSVFYQNVTLGQRLCLFEPQGPLRMRWREIDACPPVLH